MPMLTDLAEACRKSGLKVVEVDGWRTRGHGPMTDVQTIACHHTATSRAASGDYPSLGIVRDGRSDLPGPLAQLGLGRSGTVYVIAAGVAYHAGETWSSSQNNWNAIGIEAEADGVSSWDPAQVDAYARLCHALIEHYGLSVARVQGHKEIAKPAGRKIDPNFDMAAFRGRVSIVSNQEDYMATSDAEKKLDNLTGRIGLLAEAVATVDTKVSDFRKVMARRYVTEIKEERANGKTLDQIVERLEREAGDA